MRRHLSVLGALVAIGVLAGGFVSPAQAATKFEGHVLAPNPGGSNLRNAVFAAEACADPKTGGDLNGINYAWVDLKADYTKFDMTGPTHLVPSGSTPAGIGDHDLDWYFYDAKCKDVTKHENLEETTKKVTSAKPVRYVMVIYWSGIYADIPFKILASN